MATVSDKKDFSQFSKISQFTVDAVDLPSVAANDVAETELSISGVTSDMECIGVIKPSLEAGLFVGGGRVTGDGTVKVFLVNPTASPLDAASENGWKFLFVAGS